MLTGSRLARAGALVAGSFDSIDRLLTLKRPSYSLTARRLLPGISADRSKLEGRRPIFAGAWTDCRYPLN